MKRIIIIFVVALCTTCTPLMSQFVYAASFTDLPAFNENYEAITALADDGILNGYPDGSFEAYESITRAEFTAVLVREFAIVENTLSNAFSDVPDSHWAKDYINIAYNNGIINGVGNCNFEPESNVTYEQVIKMMVAALGYNQDAIDKGGYPAGYLAVGEELNLNVKVKGEVGTAATRGMVAQIVYNARNLWKPVELPKTHYTSSGSVPIRGGNIDLYTENSDCKIYYTMDGSDPTSSSDIYMGYSDMNLSNLKVFHSMTIKAIAVNEHEKVSDIAAFHYDVPVGDMIYDLCVYANENIRSTKLNNKELEELHYEIMNTINFNYDWEDINTTQKMADEYKKILSGISSNSSETEKEKHIFDYLVNNTEYDYTLMNGCAYDLLTEGSGVCQAYAEATQISMRLAGIESQVVSGRADGSYGWDGHEWNIVKINGKYYHLDTTWARFNCSDDFMSRDHSWSVGYYPECDSDWDAVVPDLTGMNEY